MSHRRDEQDAREQNRPPDESDHDVSSTWVRTTNRAAAREVGARPRPFGCVRNIRDPRAFRATKNIPKSPLVRTGMSLGNCMSPITGLDPYVLVRADVNTDYLHATPAAQADHRQRLALSAPPPGTSHLDSPDPHHLSHSGRFSALERPIPIGGEAAKLVDSPVSPLDPHRPRCAVAGQSEDYAWVRRGAVAAINLDAPDECASTTLDDRDACLQRVATAVNSAHTEPVLPLPDRHSAARAPDRCC